MVIGIRMPPNLADNGLRAVLRIRADQPTVGVIMLSQFLDAGYAPELVCAGPSGVGYLLKEKVASHEMLADGPRVVGGWALDPDVIVSHVNRKRTGDPLGVLTPRERKVLSWPGPSTAGIAPKLFGTVPPRWHVNGIFPRTWTFSRRAPAGTGGCWPC